MTRTTPELPPLFPDFRTTLAGECSHWTKKGIGSGVDQRAFGHYIWFSEQQVHIHGGSSVESGFQPETLLPQSRDLTTAPS
ncbi:hypothetical protein AVEN_252417-1 [Araneus ventricosus]|uniref:Uncharacterized protein n=1 Tax=Araneus ventricosus TaxID=182803 RepID=A0A4Y2AQL3_ARAVE|nr:hypothetical protein AVEN_252417-1 [Araneus ventricosus]